MTACCPACNEVSPRVFTAPQFTEDRRRFAGERLSAATGQLIAQSRTQERMIEKAMDIEFMTKADAPANVKNAAAYSQHLRTGGDPLPNKVVAALVSPPPEKKKTIVEMMRENPVRLGEIPTDRPIQGKPLPPFPKDVTL